MFMSKTVLVLSGSVNYYDENNRLKTCDDVESYESHRTGSYTIDADDGVDIESSSGNLEIGVDNHTGSVQIGTGGVRNISLGHSLTASLTVDGGSGQLIMLADGDGALDVGGALTLGTALTDSVLIKATGNIKLDPLGDCLTIPPENTIYVGQHGDDAWRGRTPMEAVATFGRAMDLCITYNINNVVGLDSLDYTEDFTIPTNRQVHTKATITGHITAGAFTVFECKELIAVDGIAYTTTGGVNSQHYFKTSSLLVNGTASGLQNGTATNILNACIDHIQHTSTGWVISTVDSSYRTNVEFRDATCSGTGAFIYLPDNGGRVCAYGSSFQNSGVAGPLIYSDAALGTPEAYIVAQYINAVNLSNIPLIVNASVVCPHVVGACAQTGAHPVSLVTSAGVHTETAYSINSLGGAITIGDDAVAQPLNLGTGAAARVITIGNAASASLAIEGGVGPITVQCDTTYDVDSGGAHSINSSGGAINIGNDADNFNINIGTAGTRTMNLGSATAPVLAGGHFHSVSSSEMSTAPNVAGGAAAITAAQLCDGYTYLGAAGGAVALTLPAIADVQTELAARGVTSAAGTRVPDVLVVVTDANALTVTAGAGGTVVGTAAVNNSVATVKTVFTAAATAHHIVVQD